MVAGQNIASNARSQIRVHFVILAPFINRSPQSIFYMSGFAGIMAIKLSHPRPAKRLVDAALPAFARGAEAFHHVAVEPKRHLLFGRRFLRATLAAPANEPCQFRKVAQRTHVPKVFGRQFADLALRIS
jgi:hypothetical protein